MFQHRLSHRVGRSSQATPAAVDKSHSASHTEFLTLPRRLPVLSTYLGHVHVADTYWYLSAWPELMSQAVSRLEQRWGDAS